MPRHFHPNTRSLCLQTPIKIMMWQHSSAPALLARHLLNVFPMHRVRGLAPIASPQPTIRLSRLLLRSSALPGASSWLQYSHFPPLK